MGMSNTVKDFFAALDRLENDALASRDGYGYSSGDAETIRRVLTENEQLRKERDELVAGIIDIVDRTVASGGVLYAGHAGQKAREIAKKVNENGNA